MKEKLEKLKAYKLVPIFISVFLALMTSITLIIYNYSKEKKEVIIHLEEGKTYQISKIMINGDSYRLENFNSENMKYNSDYNFLYSDSKSNDFTIDLSSVDDLEITFINNTDNGLITIREKSKYKNKVQKLETRSDEISFTAIGINTRLKELLSLYNDSINFKIKLIYVIVTIISMFIYYYLLKLLKKIMYSIYYEKLNYIIGISSILLITFGICLLNVYSVIEIFSTYFVLLEILLFLYIYFKNKEIFKKLENFFALIAIFLGMNFIFILPQYNVPDEASHFIKAYMVVNKVPTENEHQITAVAILPYELLYASNPYTRNIMSPEFKVAAKSVIDDFNIRYNSSNETFGIGIGNVTNLPNFCYYGTALVIKVCQLLSAPVILSFLLSRFLNFAIFIIAMYHIIKNVKYFKKSFLVVGLLPITIQQAAGVDQDSLTNTIIFFSIYYTFKLAFSEKKVNIKDFIVCSILSIMLSYCKLAYFPILLLLFLIPRKNFDNNKRKFLFIGAILILNFAFTAKNVLNIYSTYTGEELYSVSYIIHNPVKTVDIILRTVLERLDLDFVGGLVTGFGWSTQWAKGLFRYTLTIIFTLLYLTANKKEAEKKVLNIKSRLILLFVAIMIFGIIYASLLTSCTGITSPIIQGLQSRYFIPVVLLVVISITNNLINIKIKDDMLNIVLMSIVVIITSFTLISGFYI